MVYSVRVTLIVICLFTVMSPRLGLAQSCASPASETIDSIKSKLISEVNESEIVRRGDERKMRPDDVNIQEAFEKDGFVLVSYQYRCCFEGGIVLYKKTDKKLKETSYFNGYDTKGTFIGFDRADVIKYLSRHVPASVKEMIACYKSQPTKVPSKSNKRVE